MICRFLLLLYLPWIFCLTKVRLRDDDTQICSCHNVTKGDISKVVKDGTCKSLGDVKVCTKAGTGCAGCIPLVQTIFNAEMKAMGAEVSNHRMLLHYHYSQDSAIH